jgi:hypothetical protein
VGDRVESETFSLERLFAAATSKQRLKTRNQLAESEGLRQVVVSAGVEAGDPVDNRVPRCEEEDRRLDSPRAQRLTQITAVGVGQADIDHEDVRLRRFEPIEQLFAAGDSFRSEAFFTKSADEQASKLVIVLDDQD